MSYTMSCCSAAADAFCFQLWLVFTWEPSWATTCAASVALEEINGTQRCCNRQGWCWAPGREGGFLGYFPTGKSRLCHRIHPNFTINGWYKHDKPSKDGWIVISLLLYLHLLTVLWGIYIDVSSTFLLEVSWSTSELSKARSQWRAVTWP